MAFAIQAETMDKKEFERFVKELPLDPGKRASVGVQSLMGLMKRGVGARV